MITSTLPDTDPRATALLARWFLLRRDFEAIFEDNPDCDEGPGSPYNLAADALDALEEEIMALPTTSTAALVAQALAMFRLSIYGMSDQEIAAGGGDDWFARGAIKIFQGLCAAYGETPYDLIRRHPENPARTCAAPGVTIQMQATGHETAPQLQAAE